MKAMYLSGLVLTVTCAYTHAEKQTEVPAAMPSVEAIAEEPAAKLLKATVIDTYSCHHANRTRIIQVLNYDGADVLCEVNYETAAGKKTLWDAKWSAEFCQKKARQFASKQVAWGWSCTDTYGVVVDAPAPKMPVGEETAPTAMPETE